MKKNRGITLIALIITIIVMLILVAVSISVALNTGLFKSASDATKNWKTAQEEESNMPIEIGGKKYNSIEEYLNGGIKEEHNWKRTGDTLTCGHCNKTYTIGDVVDYTDSGAESTSITAEKAGGYTGTSALVNSGVKVASLKLSNNFKIAKASGPAQPTKTQTIQKDENITWIVLGAEDSNNNGTNETLLITTKEPTTGTIILYGAAGYNNCIDEINRMCKELYGEEARGMTIEDVNNCLQYTPTGGTYLDEDGNIQTTNNFTTKLNELPTEIWNLIKKFHYTPDGKNTEENFGEVLLNAYWYKASENATFTNKEKEIIFGNTDGNDYWLASRGVLANANDVSAYFGPGYVEKGTANSYLYMFGSGLRELGGEKSLRAVVPLKSDIPGL